MKMKTYMTTDSFSWSDVPSLASCSDCDDHSATPDPKRVPMHVSCDDDETDIWSARSVDNPTPGVNLPMGSVCLGSLECGSTDYEGSNTTQAVIESQIQVLFAEQMARDMQEIVNWYCENHDETDLESRRTNRQSLALGNNSLLTDFVLPKEERRKPNSRSTPPPPPTPPPPTPQQSSC